jgi:hypothetical protein
LNRECGPCTECCYVLGVHELNKRNFTHCQHERRSSAGGCGIYKDRPLSCREFKCLWLQGQGGRKDRPDRVGIVFATADMEVRQVVIAFVRKPGADKAGRGFEIMHTLAQQVPVCILRWDGTRGIMAGEQFSNVLPQIQREFNDRRATVGEDGRLRRLPLV